MWLPKYSRDLREITHENKKLKSSKNCIRFEFGNWAHSFSSITVDFGYDLHVWASLGFCTFFPHKYTCGFSHLFLKRHYTAVRLCLLTFFLTFWRRYNPKLIQFKFVDSAIFSAGSLLGSSIFVKQNSTELFCGC